MQFSLDTWGNNIANVDTVGFRSSTPEFASLLSQNANTAAMAGFGDVGLGATQQATTVSTAQGSLMSTDNTFDLALAGRGYFGVQGPEDKRYYTRNGEFNVDANGYLVDSNGYKVLGQVNPTMVIDKNLNATIAAGIANIGISDPKKQAPIQIPTTMTNPGVPGIPAVTSTTSPIEYTLQNSSTGTGSTVVDPVNISYYLTADTVPTMHIKNSAGVEVKTVDLASQGKGQHTYVWDGKIPTPATNSDGTAILDASGNPIMQNSYAPAGQYTVTVDYVSKVAVPAIPPGELQQYQVDTNGNITAKFSNGLNSVIGQIPIFQFSNQQGLSKEGDNLYSESANSGQVMLYKDSKGVYMPGVEVQSNMLETSNVSLSDAMTELIVTQRAFDANSKCVTTSDQMIQKALALKRG